MIVLGSILTYLILAVTLVLAAAVAGLMAYHYAKARLRERKGFSYDPETDTTEVDSGVSQRAKSAEEIAQIRARIEALMEQQHIRSETQSQHLAQKLDEIRTHMNSQDHKMDGIKSELRHEIRRRDSELEDLRHQLASALDAFWKSMPALADGSPSGDSLALPPAARPADAVPMEAEEVEEIEGEEIELVEAVEASDHTSAPLLPEDPSPWTLPEASLPAEPVAAEAEADVPATPVWTGASAWAITPGGAPPEPSSAPPSPRSEPVREAVPEPPPATWSSPFAFPPGGDSAEGFAEIPPEPEPMPFAESTPEPPAPEPPAPPRFAPMAGAFSPPSPPPAEEVSPVEELPPVEEVSPVEDPPQEATPAWGSILDAAAVPTGEPRFAPPVPPAPEAAPPPVPATPPPAAVPASAPAAPEPAAPPIEGDDLTLITGIDEAIQQRLYLAGVTSLDEMARWSRADARRVSGAIGVSEETIMHQWIFEAQSVLFEHYQQQMAQPAA